MLLCGKSLDPYHLHLARPICLSLVAPRYVSLVQTEVPDLLAVLVALAEEVAEVS